jgi:hypothetical protein
MGIGGFDPAALDRYITGNYGEDQFAHLNLEEQEWADFCPKCKAADALIVIEAQEFGWLVECTVCTYRTLRATLEG